MTGKSVADLVRTRIVEPLGLRHTTVAPDDRQSPDMRGYSSDTADGSLVDLTDDFLAFGNGASGGEVSTADELLAVMQAIVSARLVSAPLVTDMVQPTDQSKGSYGLGLATYKLSCGRFYGH